MEFRLKTHIAAALGIILLTGCATTTPRSTAPGREAFAAFVDGETRKTPFQHAVWAVLIEEEDGTVVYERNAHVLMMPASNRKMFTSATVATCLGLDHRLTTTLWRDGNDLVIRGDGDPSFGAARYGREGDLALFLEAVRRSGLTAVRDVVADPSRFDRVTLPGGWKLGNLLRPYSAPVDAIAWRENNLDDTAPPDPALAAALALRDALELRGVPVGGSVRVDLTPRPRAVQLEAIASPFIGEMLRTVLKNSHNLYAEMLLKRIAPEPSSYDAALAFERTFLVGEAGLDPLEFQFVDGSGLAPDDLMTASSAVRVLRWMNHPLRAGYWWSTLATPAESGTLRQRLVPLASSFRGKTGTLNGVAALSGILRMTDGRTRYVSVVVNHHNGTTDDAEAIIDAIVMKAAGVTVAEER